VKWGTVGGRVRGPTLDGRQLIDPEAPIPRGGERPVAVIPEGSGAMEPLPAMIGRRDVA